MRARSILIVMFMPALVVQTQPSLGKSAIRTQASAQRVSIAPAPVLVRAARPAVAQVEPMVVRTGANRHGPVQGMGNGIAGADLARPVVRGTVGGASARSDGIDGGSVRHRH